MSVAVASDWAIIGAVGLVAVVILVVAIALLRRSPSSVRLTASWDVHLQVAAQQEGDPEPHDQADQHDDDDPPDQPHRFPPPPQSW